MKGDLIISCAIEQDQELLNGFLNTFTATYRRQLILTHHSNYLFASSYTMFVAFLKIFLYADGCRQQQQTL